MEGGFKTVWYVAPKQDISVASNSEELLGGHCSFHSFADSSHRGTVERRAMCAESHVSHLLATFKSYHQQ